jgi:hypothetical protein
MLIDCDTCTVRGASCRDCVITVILNNPQPVDLDDDEQAAVISLAAAGLLPPLRLVSVISHEKRGIA